MTRQRHKNKVYFSTSDVAQLIGVSVQTARRMLKREKATRKMGGRWVTSRAMLIAAFPEVLREVAGQ